MLEIIAGSWPLAFMFAALMLAFVFSYLIFKTHRSRMIELDYRALNSRDVTRHHDSAG